MYIPSLKETKVQKTILNSRFIGILFPCFSLEQFSKHQSQLKKEYSDAGHVCYAYRFMDSDNGQVMEGFSDDGEPRGSAGKPMLAPLRGKDLINVACFIVRYFGGTKLGVGGLVRAYGGVSSELATGCKPVLFKPKQTIYMDVDYSLVDSLKHFLASIHILDQDIKMDFSDRVEVQIEADKDQAKLITKDWARQVLK